MKLINLIPQKTKIMVLILTAAALAIVSICAVIFSRNAEDNAKANDTISITDEDLRQYRQNIGDSMDIKKSILIIFNTQEECQTFIDKHGGEADPLASGEGITPLMENGYFNCVGNSVFEPLFDNMQDNEYVKEPVNYGGAYCYFKRLENYSVADSDEDLKEFIKMAKSMEKGGEIDEKNN